MGEIIVENISKKFRVGFKKHQSTLARFISFFYGGDAKHDLEAFKNISFRADSGKIIGIIGNNGSGKSTLLRVIAGIYKADSGKITSKGKIVSLINLSVGMKPKLTMRENIFLCCSLFGLGRKEIAKKFDLIVEFSGLKDFVETKIFQFSAGMVQRLAFSIAIYCNPDILLLDEVFEVGDQNFREKSAQKIKELVSRGACAISVSHDLNLMEKYCQRTIWISKGKIIKEGNTKEIILEYQTSEHKINGKSN
jgi:ABC-type polysaccharide/polyol phosphate transport system ATPase subunit